MTPAASPSSIPTCAPICAFNPFAYLIRDKSARRFSPGLMLSAGAAVRVWHGPGAVLSSQRPAALGRSALLSPKLRSYSRGELSRHGGANAVRSFGLFVSPTAGRLVSLRPRNERGSTARGRRALCGAGPPLQQCLRPDRAAGRASLRDADCVLHARRAPTDSLDRELRLRELARTSERTRILCQCDSTARAVRGRASRSRFAHEVAYARHRARKHPFLRRGPATERRPERRNALRPRPRRTARRRASGRTARRPRATRGRPAPE